VRALHHPCLRKTAVSPVEAVDCGQNALRRDLIDRAAAADTVLVSPVLGCPVEVAVSGLNQCSNRIFPRAKSAKAVQPGQRAGWRYFENRSRAARPAKKRGAIEISVTGLNQTRLRRFAVGAIECVQFRQRATAA